MSSIPPTSTITSDGEKEKKFDPVEFGLQAVAHSKIPTSVLKCDYCTPGWVEGPPCDKPASCCFDGAPPRCEEHTCSCMKDDKPPPPTRVCPGCQIPICTGPYCPFTECACDNR